MDILILLNLPIQEHDVFPFICTYISPSHSNFSKDELIAPSEPTRHKENFLEISETKASLSPMCLEPERLKLLLHQAMEPKIDVNTVKSWDKGWSDLRPLSPEGITTSDLFSYMNPNNSLPPKPVFGWHFCYLQPRSSLIQKIRWLVKEWVTRQPQSRPAVLSTSFQQPEQHCLWTKLDPCLSVCVCVCVRVRVHSVMSHSLHPHGL